LAKWVANGGSGAPSPVPIPCPFPPYPPPPRMSYASSQPLNRLIPCLDERGIDLLSRMLCYDPAKRISAAEALSHAYFSDLQPPLRSLDEEVRFMQAERLGGRAMQSHAPAQNAVAAFSELVASKTFGI
jgi:serine/threonine protein kinase